MDPSELRKLKNAVTSGDKQQVKQLLQEKLDYKCQISGEILWDALLTDHLEIASMLIQADVNLQLTKPNDQLNFSILHHLIWEKIEESKRKRLLKLTMKHGANVNACDKYGRSVIYHAIVANSTLDLINELLNYQAKVDGSLIFPAVNHPNAMELLHMLLYSESIDNEDVRYELVSQALFRLCCMVGYEKRIVQNVKTLLDLKFPVEKIDRDGSAFSTAVKRNEIELVWLLIDHGFDVNKPAFGIPPLTVSSGLQQSSMSALLLEAGAKVNERAYPLTLHQGQYPIHSACENGSLANIQLLLRHGADINRKDNRNYTPFRLIKFIDGCVCDTHKIIIRHLAVMTSKGKRIDENDLKVIECNSVMHSYYERCLNELKFAKDKRIIDNISFFSCFQDCLREICYSMRIRDFTKEIQRITRKCDFPIYHEDMDFAFENALKKRKNLIDKEDALCESLCMTLPYVPLERIVYYLYLNDVQ